MRKGCQESLLPNAAVRNECGRTPFFEVGWFYSGSAAKGAAAAGGQHSAPFGHVKIADFDWQAPKAEVDGAWVEDDLLERLAKEVPT